MRTPRAIALSVASLVATTVWAQSDPAQYSFEAGKQAWTSSGGAILSAESTSAKPYQGARSLEVVFNANRALSGQQVVVANPPVGPGKVVTFRVFVPEGMAIRSLQVFVQESAATGWRWTANWQPSSALTLGAWNTFTVTVPLDASALQALGVNFETSGPFSGTVYVDSVSWPGAAPTPPPSSMPPPSASGYSFEQGVEGWASSASGVAASNARAFDGSQSLEVKLNSPASQAQQVSVANPAVPAGSTVSFHLYLPAGAPIKSVQIFAQESVATAWRWTAVWQPAAALTLGAWNTLSLTIPANASTVQSLGAEVELSTPWVGSVYVDAVTWGGGSSTPPSPPPPSNPPPSTNSCLRIMPLGDSITEGVTGGYRNVLYTDMNALSCGVNYVGSRFDPYAEVGDKDHEGHPGFSIGDISREVQPWIAAYSPDYILLMIGTNDIAWWTVKSGAELAADQAALIDNLQQLRPTAWIVVASIPPIASQTIPPNNVDRAQLGRDYNAAMKTRIDARIAAGQKIRYADVYSSLTLADLYDGVHPTQAAHAKVAHVWRQALQGIVSCSSIPASCGP